LSDVELREQLDRYRVAGAGAEVVEWGRRRRVIRIASRVPESLVDRLADVERACCPFFDLTWDRASRCLAISASSSREEPALDAIIYALRVVDPTDASSHPAGR
jgi:hypothetical protein